MKRFIASSLLTLTSLFLFCGQLHAAVVYNHGTSTTHNGGYCSDCEGVGWTVYDDFTLGANTVVGGIEWDAAYYLGTDTSSDITISFSSAVGSGLIASSTFTWSDVVTSNNSDYNSTFYADLADLAFSAGTYYISIYAYNHFMPNSGGDGVWQIQNNTTYVRDSAYIPCRLVGENDVVGHVPVPTTLVRRGLGLFAVGVCQRRKKA
jgi:hypothetical protein